MVDLKSQYAEIKNEVDRRIQGVIHSTSFIKGPEVAEFEEKLGEYLSTNVIGCANGTDALQIALMALDLKPGDEVVVPSFTYIASAEVIGLLNLVPVLCDVDSKTFNISASSLEASIGPKTKAVVAVHLFGQCADMEAVMDVAERHNLFVIEDNAQAIGSKITSGKFKGAFAGTIGTIGTTSFFPSKNLGCYGDGGAITTNDEELAVKIKMVANHGQKRRYYHDVIGVNSRLDSIQAAVLNAKLPRLNDYSSARLKSATIYDELLADCKEVVVPFRADYSTHVFHQYTLKVPSERRDELVAYLGTKNIPTGVYYPLPIHEQLGFKGINVQRVDLDTSIEMAKSVISLPIHTHLPIDQQEFITDQIKAYFNGK